MNPELITQQLTEQDLQQIHQIAQNQVATPNVYVSGQGFAPELDGMDVTRTTEQAAIGIVALNQVDEKYADQQLNYFDQAAYVAKRTVEVAAAHQMQQDALLRALDFESSDEDDLVDA